MHAVLPRGGQERFELELNDFYVPSWWMTFSSDGSSTVEPELHNVVELQIATGDSRLIRNEIITINGVRFDGKWISSTELNAGIIGFWLLVFALRFVVQYRSISQSLKRHKSSVLDLKSLNRLLDIEKEKFANMAKHDELTKLLNRAGARDILFRVQQAYTLRSQTSSMILLDIDDFKQINDTHGHIVGDQVLFEVAQLLESNSRHYDHVIRWGGEEFVIVCEKSAIDKAVKFAEKLRAMFEQTTFAQDLQVTCSFGVSEIKSNETEAWFQEADDKLYRAKSDGKNKVISSEP